MKLGLVFRAGWVFAGIGVLSACMVGPRYSKPPVTAPAAFKELGDWKIAQPRDAINRGPWWEIFGDTQLNALAQQVEVSNQNVRVAEAKLRPPHLNHAASFGTSMQPVPDAADRD